MYFISKKIKRVISETSKIMDLSEEKVAVFLMGFIAGMLETNLELLRIDCFPRVRISNPEFGKNLADRSRIKTLETIKTKLENDLEWQNGIRESLGEVKAAEKTLGYTDAKENEWFQRGITFGALYAYLFIFETIDSDQAYDEMKQKIFPSQDYQKGIKKSHEFVA